jgi:quercetin dioxygenase-like cupin family protein
MMRLAPALVAACLASCAGNPAQEMLKPRTQVLESAMLQRMLREAPLAADEDLRAELLLESEEFSAYLVQFRSGESRHIHRTHDQTFIVYRGHGEIYINDRRRPCQPGDVFHIPRGTPHSCVNTGPQPLVVVNIFTPPFDGKDRIPLPRESRSYEREAAHSR